MKTYAPAFLGPAMDLLPSPALVLELDTYEICYANTPAVEHPDRGEIQRLTGEPVRDVPYRDETFGWVVCSALEPTGYRNRPTLRVLTTHTCEHAELARDQHQRIHTALEFNEIAEQTIRTMEQNILALDASIKAQRASQDLLLGQIGRWVRAFSEKSSVSPLT